MKALCWHGKSDMRYETVPDPKIQHPRDATIKVTACAICGSDLHIYNGVIPEMESGNVLGHETQAVSGRPPWRNRGVSIGTEGSGRLFFE